MSNSLTILAITIRSEFSANFCPEQMRRPLPHEYELALLVHVTCCTVGNCAILDVHQRSGLNLCGSEYSSSSWWMAQVFAKKIVPAGKT